MESKVVEADREVTYDSGLAAVALVRALAREKTEEEVPDSNPEAESVAARPCPRIEDRSDLRESMGWRLLGMIAADPIGFEARCPRRLTEGRIGKDLCCR